MSCNQTSSCHEYPCRLYRNGYSEESSAMISDEIAWDLWLNGRCIRHMTSSPHELDVLAIGYCLQQGLIENGQAVRVCSRYIHCRRRRQTGLGEQPESHDRYGRAVMLVRHAAGRIIGGSSYDSRRS